LSVNNKLHVVTDQLIRFLKKTSVNIQMGIIWTTTTHGLKNPSIILTHNHSWLKTWV